MISYHNSGCEKRNDSLVFNDSSSFRVRHDEEVQLLQVRLHRVAVVAHDASSKVLQCVTFDLKF